MIRPFRLKFTLISILFVVGMGGVSKVYAGDMTGGESFDDFDGDPLGCDIRIIKRADGSVRVVYEILDENSPRIRKTLSNVKEGQTVPIVIAHYRGKYPYASQIHSWYARLFLYRPVGHDTGKAILVPRGNPLEPLVLHWSAEPYLGSRKGEERLHQRLEIPYTVHPLLQQTADSLRDTAQAAYGFDRYTRSDGVFSVVETQLEFARRKQPVLPDLGELEWRRVGTGQRFHENVVRVPRDAPKASTFPVEVRPFESPELAKAVAAFLNVAATANSPTQYWVQVHASTCSVTQVFEVHLRRPEWGENLGQTFSVRGVGHFEPCGSATRPQFQRNIQNAFLR